MSSINPFYTFEYVQPSEYHFSHDSVFLARKVYELIQKENLNFDHCLDLCSGCGIIGLDLTFHLKKENDFLPKQFDFIDVQNIYQDYFHKNLETLKSNFLMKSDLNYNFICANYDELMTNDSYKNKYNLIVCNPPYFRKQHGALSKSEFKNRCRFFLDSDFKNLILAIQHLLSAKGKAFVLLKSLERHGIDIQSELDSFGTQLSFTNLGLIRETNLFQINFK